MGLSILDWSVLLGTMAFIIVYGVWKSRGQKDVASYIKGDSDTKWWTIGLSVMATQASAITFMSTPGQAYSEGMGFVQFYFGLPLAMVVICLFFIPLYRKANVLTAYEYLENRFDKKVRTLTATLFLIQRGLGAGITIYAPAIILSTILGWDLTSLNIIIGIIVILYTVSGGTKAVSITQKQQMIVIFIGMICAFATILYLLPEHVGFKESLDIAGMAGRMNIVDLEFDINNRYNIWSGLTGGFFLALAYFGTDQSQVQRYLAGNSERASKLGLIFNGLLKVPMQFFILLTGLMVFVFYQFQQAPIFFNEATVEQVYQTTYANEFNSIQLEYDYLSKERIEYLSQNKVISGDIIQDYNTKEASLRDRAKVVISNALPNRETNDKDYVFINFILKYLPHGLIGLLLAVIFSAAMSSTASELNALGSTTALDIYNSNIANQISDAKTLSMTKWFTVLWGIMAIAFACTASLFENLIQFVNIIGSLFYGTMLGIFLVGFFLKNIGATSVFIAAIISEIFVIFIFNTYDISYLWLNVIGAANVVIIARCLDLTKKLKSNYAS